MSDLIGWAREVCTLSMSNDGAAPDALALMPTPWGVETWELGP